MLQQFDTKLETALDAAVTLLFFFFLSFYFYSQDPTKFTSSSSVLQDSNYYVSPCYHASNYFILPRHFMFRHPILMAHTGDPKILVQFPSYTLQNIPVTPVRAHCYVPIPIPPVLLARVTACERASFVAIYGKETTTP